ncbi:hypothetical protein AB3X82_27740 [Paraburkholderia phenoliruptrix]|uniref:Uncharacterized protein n=1 Tax=Paraburkholderia phenoliruptrix TaxID=252970 RepID=A0ABV3WLB7_9BURK|nr:hypothetical protein [Paraburkholderia phenoliruptrix]MDR6391820.1 hypothetical protein [Paraburkholderia phenoliruptrix]
MKGPATSTPQSTLQGDAMVGLNCSAIDLHQRAVNDAVGVDRNRAGST